MTLLFYKYSFYFQPGTSRRRLRTQEGSNIATAKLGHATMIVPLTPVPLELYGIPCMLTKMQLKTYLLTQKIRLNVWPNGMNFDEVVIISTIKGWQDLAKVIFYLSDDLEKIIP